MSHKSDKTYWPHMILGFLGIGIMLGYWTVSSAINMPVQTSNEFHMKYQQVDMHINEIMDSNERFNERYVLKLLDFKKSDFSPNKFSKRTRKEIYKLEYENNIKYSISTSDGKPVSDANVTLLITRPHTIADDRTILLKNSKQGQYSTSSFKLSHKGRYLLRVRASIADATGFLDYEAYLE